MITPQKSESPAATGQTQNEITDTEILNESNAERKRFDTLAARTALNGHTLVKVGSGLLLSRWGHVRHFVDLDTAEALILRMEGGKP